MNTPNATPRIGLHAKLAEVVESCENTDVTHVLVELQETIIVVQDTMSPHVLKQLDKALEPLTRGVSHPDDIRIQAIFIAFQAFVRLELNAHEQEDRIAKINADKIDGFKP